MRQCTILYVSEAEYCNQIQTRSKAAYVELITASEGVGENNQQWWVTSEVF